MILIISNRTDVTVDFVVKELKNREINFTRFNTDEYPTNILGTVKFEGNSTEKYLIIKDRDRIVDFNKIRSILYRRPIPPVVDSTISNESIRKFCTDECYDFIRGLWLSVNGFWMSHPEAIRMAEHKIYQLKIAQQCNFSIPKTIVTNNPQELREFITCTSHEIIIKPLYIGFIEKSISNEALMIYTTKINKNDLDNIEDISYSPSIFQECIDKIFDVRVTIVGNEVFSARINAKNNPDNIPDWRYAETENLEHTIYTLPDNVKLACLKLVKSLNLEFGAIDLAVDKEKNHFFLEINPNGQWAWLELVLGLPISKAIVDHLVENQK